MKEKKMTASERVLLLLECLKKAEEETQCKLVVLDEDMMIYDCIEHQLYAIDTSGIEVKHE